jgi:hypothetical protein
MTRTTENTTEYEAVLDRPEDTPTRYVLATLAGSDRFWGVLVVGLPIVFLVLSWFDPLLAPIAVSLPLVVALWLVWMSHEFIDSTTRTDRAKSTIAKTKPYSDEYYDPIGADQVSSVSILEFPDIALVNIGPEKALSTETPAVVVSPTDIRAFRADLEAMGIEVSSQRRAVSLSISSRSDIRIWGTPISMVTTLSVAGVLHGIEPFKSNAFVILLLMLLGYALYGVLYRDGLDRSNV